MTTIHHKINRKQYHSLTSFGYTNPLQKDKEINTMKKEEFNSKKATKVESEIEFWMPKEAGDELVGILNSKYEGNFGTTYVFECDGKLRGTPSHAMLQNALSAIPLGNAVRIVMSGHGEAKPGQSKPVLYDVEHYNPAE